MGKRGNEKFDIVGGHLRCFLGDVWLINRSLLIGALPQSDEIQSIFFGTRPMNWVMW